MLRGKLLFSSEYDKVHAYPLIDDITLLFGNYIGSAEV